MKTQINNQSGFSLIEIMVALTIFIAVMLMSTAIFQQILMGQKRAIAGQNGQESIRYIFEIISKELRMAKRFTNDSSGGDNCEDRLSLNIAGDSNRIFHVDNNVGNQVGNELYFKNERGFCVKYSLDGDDDFYVERVDESTGDANEGVMTPSKVSISNLEFSITDSTSYTDQPKVTVLMVYELDNGNTVETMTMQTTVSARYYPE